MCPRTTSIASAAPGVPAPPAKPSPWSPPMNPDCSATSNEFYAAAFQPFRRRCSRWSSRRRRPLLTATGPQAIAPRATTIALRAAVLLRRRAKAVKAITGDVIRAARRPAAVREPEASVSSSAVASARTVWEPTLADSRRSPHPGSDASGRIPRSPAGIRACCRSRSACLRIRRHTRVRAASAGQCRR